MNRDFPVGEWSVPIELAREPDFQLGGVRVRPSGCEVEIAKKLERVEPRVMQALVALAQRQGAVVTKDELVQRCWGGRVVGEDAINRCIAKVRKLSELDGGHSFKVETIPKIGLRLSLCKPATPRSTLQQDCVSEETQREASPLAPRRRRWLAWPIVGSVLIGVGAFAFLLVTRDGHNMSAEREIAPVTHAAEGLSPGATFRDCGSGCPHMVVIPSGYFMMGSDRNERATPAIDLDYGGDASPQHEVLIKHRFALGRYAVTRGEYARFALVTHRTNDGDCYSLTRSGLYVETLNASWRHPGFEQTDRDPVVCVNWYDAMAYVNWLSQRTGKLYRLPSEAELEYAARAGSQKARPDDGLPGADCRQFNGADADYHMLYPGDSLYESKCGDHFVHTSPVGSFPANAFGLSDMLGNAAEWTADCYHESYDGAPTNGSAWVTGDCTIREVRGGSWESDSRKIEFATRASAMATGRWDANTFRVARDL